MTETIDQENQNHSYTVRKASPVQIKKYAEAEMEEAKIENNKLEEKEYASKYNLNVIQPPGVSFERPQISIEIPGKGGSPRDVTVSRGPGNR
jgi:hypothetical protein